MLVKIIDVFLGIIGAALTIIVATLHLLWLCVLLSLGLLYFFLAFPVISVKHMMQKKSRHQDGIKATRNNNHTEGDSK